MHVMFLFNVDHVVPSGLSREVDLCTAKKIVTSLTFQINLAKGSSIIFSIFTRVC